MELKKINLGEKLIIYKTNYNWNYTKEQFLKRVDQNFIINEGITDDNTSLINLKCKEFESIYNLALKSISIICNLTNNWEGEHLHTNWIYRQNKYSKLQGYHLHKYTHTKAKILNNWSYCFYLSIPNNIKDNEGCIMFKDEDDVEYVVHPNEGDIIFFNNTTPHSPTLTPSAEKYRISICGNISFNIPEIKNIKSTI